MPSEALQTHRETANLNVSIGAETVTCSAGGATASYLVEGYYAIFGVPAGPPQIVSQVKAYGPPNRTLTIDMTAQFIVNNVPVPGIVGTSQIFLATGAVGTLSCYVVPPLVGGVVVYTGFTTPGFANFSGPTWNY